LEIKGGITVKTRLILAGFCNICGGLLVLASLAMYIFGYELDAIYFLITGLMGSKLADDLSEGK
jgi:hypothetical protein